MTGTCWTMTGRCPNQADTVMIAPDGDRIPGLYCAQCTARAIAEYAEKLGEIWTSEPAS